LSKEPSSRAREITTRALSASQVTNRLRMPRDSLVVLTMLDGDCPRSTPLATTSRRFFGVLQMG
jgi:hypothetical protein